MTPNVNAAAPVGLSSDQLNTPAERTYFVIALIISLLVWFVLVISIIGLGYALFIGLFLWFANGLLTAHLRSEAIRVDAQQLPELHATFIQVCERLGVKQPPALYVLQAGGVLNAFATRFSGRDFVVVYSEFVEALGATTPEMRFVLGHELGHIRSRHVLKQIGLAPGLFFPLSGPAYRRAWESSADRYGAFAANNVDGSVHAMLVLSAGPEQSRQVNAGAFAGQYREERGFFVSLHELISTYPTLSRRVTDLMSLKDGSLVQRPSRHPLAYLFALMIPGGNVGGGGASGLLVSVAAIGLMGAMAVPAFQKVRQNSNAAACISNQRMLTMSLEQYEMENNKRASDVASLVGPGKLKDRMPLCPAHGTYSIVRTSEGYAVVCSEPQHSLDKLRNQGGL